MHQGFCKKKRMHFHLRHIRNDNLDEVDSNDKYNFTDKYKKECNLEHHNTRLTYDKKIFERLVRYKTFIQYFLPRFKFIINNLFKKENTLFFTHLLAIRWK